MKRVITILLLLVVVAAAQATESQTFAQLSSSAQHAYESNHPAEAARLFARALKLQPGWAQGWWALGMINYEQDHYLQCRDALARMVKLDTSAAPGFALLGLCEFRLKQYDSAFQHLKKAHVLVPVTQSGGPLIDMADYHLALLLTRQGAFEVAQEVLMHVALKVRDNPEMMYGAGLACLRMPILPADIPPSQREVVAMAGKAFWDLIAERPEVTEAAFKALVAKYPAFPNVHYFYGTYLVAHHPEQCLTEFLAELRVSPDSVPARVQIALHYIVDMRFDDAIKQARDAVALSPQSVGAQLALAEALKAKGDDGAALAVFQEAERLDPVSPKVRLYLVNAYRTVGRIADSRREQAEYDRLKSQQQNWP